MTTINQPIEWHHADDLESDDFWANHPMLQDMALSVSVNYKGEWTAYLYHKRIAVFNTRQEAIDWVNEKTRDMVKFIAKAFQCMSSFSLMNELPYY